MFKNQHLSKTFCSVAVCEQKTNRSPAFPNRFQKSFLRAFSALCPDLIIFNEKTEQENLGTELVKIATLCSVGN